MMPRQGRHDAADCGRGAIGQRGREKHMRSAKRRGKDELFRAVDRPVADFSFNAETASVFDDMLERSVPFYAEIQRMLAELAGDFAADGTRDLRPRLLDRHDAATLDAAARRTSR